MRILKKTSVLRLWTLVGLWLLSIAGLPAQPGMSALGGGAPDVKLPPEMVKFEREIRWYEQADSIAFPEGKYILFTGSSSVRKWDSLSRDMGPLPVLNRGFGGSTIPLVSHYADRIILPYRPRIIVLYAGENDLSEEEVTPDSVLNWYKTFTQYIHYHLPDCRILYVSMKPSPSRWKLWDKFTEGNALIRAYIETDERQEYVDISEAMLDENGRVRKDIFIKDRLHMNEEGYAIWTRIIRPRVEAMMKTLQPYEQAHTADENKKSGQ